MSGSPLYPVVWVSSPDKTLHFHCLEFHNGITRKHRAKAFQNRFGKLTKLPKDLYQSVIQSTRTDSYIDCYYYGHRGHNQIITELMIPKSWTEEIPLTLMGQLNENIKGQARMIEKYGVQEDDFLSQLLAMMRKD